MAGPVSVAMEPSRSSVPIAVPSPSAPASSSLQATAMAALDTNTAQELSGCQNCEYREAEVSLSGEDEVVTLTSEEGGPVVTLSVPAGLTSAGVGQISVQFARERDSYVVEEDGSSTIKSAVVDITLVVDGQVITQLDEPLEICLTFSEGQVPPSREELCLSYFDVLRQEWRCEDLGLTLNAEGQFCGETGHLTSFALLLGGDTGSSGEYFPQSTIAWISLGFLVGALVFVIFGVVAVELRYLKKRREDHVMYRQLGSKMKSISES